jgi:two-component system, OmpR family, phosphate regulon sensor histidine kinase PhoR
MEFKQQQRLAVVLMALSLGLLLVFLGVFLRRVYQEELDALKKESGLLFENAVRTVETGLMEKIILMQGKMDHDTLLFSPAEPACMPLEPLPGIAQIRETRIVKKDSLKVITFIGKDQVLQAPNDGGHTLKISTSTTPKAGYQDMVGSISVFLDLTKGQKDTFQLRRNTGDMLGDIQRRFAQAIDSSNFQVAFRIVNDSEQTSDGLEVGTYTDVASGDRVRFELFEVRGYLWKKMWPQALFGLVLLGTVALAFAFIYRTLRQQYQLAEQKNDFIRNMTHELKTPIATVSVAIEALQNFDALHNPARTQEYLGITRHELSRLSLLVDKVLRMSLFEKNEPELKPEWFDFRALVEEILQTMKLQFEKYGARVGVQFSGEQFQLHGDRMHLAGVVYNLVDNALKYGGGQPEIDLQLAAEEQQLVLQVRDNGAGIPPDYQDKIFEKFFRIPTGNTHNVKGHGLGLSYVAGVIRQHRGHIGVGNANPVGAVFTVTLPTQAVA